MQTLTYTEENYIKAIYTIQHKNDSGEVSVNEIAERMQTPPATVTDMFKKLSEKDLINYEKYKKTRLTDAGSKIALSILRKHRLWETFLHNKLNFAWDEVHEVAEQLEHIHSQKLIDKMDEFLGFPKYDPHGDPIPGHDGEIPASKAVPLTEMPENVACKLVAVNDSSSAFLQQLKRFSLEIGSVLTITERMPYDNSLWITNNSTGNSIQLSEKLSGNILVI